MRPAHDISLSLLLASSVLIGGCSPETPSDNPAASGSKAPRASQSKKVNAPAAAAAAVYQSEFSTNPALTDPFFPQAKRRTEVATTTTPQPLDAERLLQEGFLGVFGAGRDRVALINNVMLESGRTATIPVRSGNQMREITVRVRNVLPTAVILDVDGRTITISTKP